MLNKLSEKYNIKVDTLKIIIFSLILILMIVFIFSVKDKNATKNEEILEVTNEELIKLFDKISDNYSLTITEKINDVEKELNYDTDSNISLYDGSLLGEDGVMLYKNKKYVIYRKELDNIKNIKLYNYKGDDSFINDPFYNVELLKRIIPYCELTPINKVKANCKVNLSNYLNEYNSLYNQNISVNYDDKINFDIVYYSDRIGKINVDYTTLNNLINKNNNNVYYGIKFVSIGENDFEDILNFFKDTLSK